MKKSTTTAIIIILVIVIIAGAIGAGVYVYNQKKNETKTVYGVVSGVKDGYLTLDAEGNVYNVNITEAYKPSETLIAGDTVKVSYTGELKNNLAASAVTLIFDVSNVASDEDNGTAENTVATTENKTAETKENTTANKPATTTEDKTEYYMTGTVVSYSGSTIKMKALNGYTYDVDISKANNDFAGKGVTAGETIRVIHYGKITGKMDTAIKALYVYKVQAVSSASDEHTIECKIIDASMHLLKVEYEGKEYNFSTATAEVNTTKGLINGYTIKITYKGNLSTTNVAIKVED